MFALMLFSGFVCLAIKELKILRLPVFFFKGGKVIFILAFSVLLSILRLLYCEELNGGIEYKYVEWKK